MDTVTFDPIKRKLIIYRDGVEVPEVEPFRLPKADWLARLRVYGFNGNGDPSTAPYTPTGKPRHEYRCIEVRDGKR